MHSITIKKDALFFITTTEEIVQDIKQFCCGANASALGVDKTFNLCNIWVIDTCYHNKRVINPETYPIFVGPTLFHHFAKDEKTFSRLALELLDTKPGLINLKIIGADMEEAITNGFKRVIPNIKVLYCARNLKQRDKIKTDNLMEKVTASAAEKVLAKADILKDIYGERKGTTYDLGLAEAANDEDFLDKLNSLDKR